jgi:hypothetical protein
MVTQAKPSAGFRTIGSRVAVCGCVRERRSYIACYASC